MNHLDSSVNSRKRFFMHPADLIVNTLAVAIVCGLLYKGANALVDADSGIMFRSIEKGVQQRADTQA
jgi:hypothetical protein